MATQPDPTEIDLSAVPSVVVDGIYGDASKNGSHRVVLAEIILNPIEGAAAPRSRPVINLVLTTAAARTIGEYLIQMVERNSDGD